MDGVLRQPATLRQVSDFATLPHRSGALLKSRREPREALFKNDHCYLRVGFGVRTRKNPTGERPEIRFVSLDRPRVALNRPAYLTEPGRLRASGAPCITQGCACGRWRLR